MRFLDNGPAIPDELLVARDEGRVIFFCGAGVSRARAGLSDFFGLAQQVIEILGVATDAPARRLIAEAQEIDLRTGISGLISADRVFGLLERDFPTRDIESAVAQALKPKGEADLSAHQILLDLARTPDGKVRLVTTNFDTLFESCDDSLPYSSPPKLPDPQSHEEFEGVIHLHGRVDKDYGGAAGAGFVLSSSEFGRAYLSDGWATSFITSVLSKYVVVFVGYTADDPPVQYLLEALNRYAESSHGIYAFQADTTGEAEAEWRAKGVHPLVYNNRDQHMALWATLEAWANRAKDPDAWYENIIALARKGPEALLPHERGQVAHVVSTLEGVRRFSASDDLPPAEWLCVFDPSIRYAQPGHCLSLRERGPYIDPFDDYGIDRDLPPPKIDPDDSITRREVPQDAWNCFAATRLDRQNLQEQNFSTVRGPWAIRTPRLPDRLGQLGVWIGKVSSQPATIWWAAAQDGIHPDIQSQISFYLSRDKGISPKVRLAWRYLFEAWQTQKDDFHHEWYQLKAEIDLDGWTDATVREFANIHRPFLKVSQPWGRPQPPANRKDIRLDEMVQVDVEYPGLPDDVQIPDHFLPIALRELRKNLEHAVSLERQLGEYHLHPLAPIEPDPDTEGEAFVRTYRLSGHFLFYVGRLKDLIDKDPQAVKSA